MTSICTAPKCSNELRDDEAGQWICSPCLRRARAWLNELPNQMTVLRGSRLRETTGNAGRPGTKTPPLPGRDDVTNLLGPFAWGPVRDEHGDQHGPLPIAGTLTGWVRLICEERRWNGPAAGTEETLATWLAAHLDYAARRPWAGDMYDELDDMIHLVRGKTRVRPARRPVTQPCPRCDELALVEQDHEAYTECGTCGSLFTREDLALAARIALAS